MSTNLNYKQVANITRRTWDVEAYEKRAKERAKNEAEGGGKGKGKGTGGIAGVVARGEDMEPERQEFVAAPEGSGVSHLADRAYLKARKSKVDGLDTKVGSVEVINPDAVATSKSNSSEGGAFDDQQTKAVIKSGVGWHCKVCDCFLKDSMTYLDHINGRKHQRALGYSMRVERSTENQVSDKLAQLAQLKQKSKAQSQQQWTIKGMGEVDDDDAKNNNTNDTKKGPYDDPTAGEDEEDLYHTLVKSKDEELRRKKEERKRERKERKKLKKKLQLQQEGQGPKQEKDEEGKNDDSKEQQDGLQEDEKEIEDCSSGQIDPDIAAMMGFSGFGGGNKNT